MTQKNAYIPQSALNDLLSFSHLSIYYYAILHVAFVPFALGVRAPSALGSLFLFVHLRSRQDILRCCSLFHPKTQDTILKKIIPFT